MFSALPVGGNTGLTKCLTKRDSEFRRRGTGSVPHSTAVLQGSLEPLLVPCTGGSSERASPCRASGADEQGSLLFIYLFLGTPINTPGRWLLGPSQGRALQKEKTGTQASWGALQLGPPRPLCRLRHRLPLPLSRR